MKQNISWLFYNDYFNGINFSKFDSRKGSFPDKGNETNESLLKMKNKYLIESVNFYPIANECCNPKHSFKLKIQYPGLVTGIGINHEINVAGEFKLGVHFDYTSGMPVIYGSSVKGVLRSVFPLDEKDEKIKAEKIKTIRDYLKEIKIEDVENLNIEELGKAIFEGEINGKKCSQYECDVFFDAVIVKDEKTDKAPKPFLQSDFITPHTEGPLKNPIPLSFLKIASGVTMEFRFCLHDCTINGVEITKEKKRNLFEQILKDFGVGAKTNVGYGQFS